VYSCFGIFFTFLPSGLDVSHRPLEGEKRRAAQIPPRYFTDYLNLLKIDGRWVVAQKVFAAVNKP
jgi:hypothetical protein